MLCRWITLNRRLFPYHMFILTDIFIYYSIICITDSEHWFYQSFEISVLRGFYLLLLWTYVSLPHGRMLQMYNKYFFINKFMSRIAHTFSSLSFCLFPFSHFSSKWRIYCCLCLYLFNLCIDPSLIFCTNQAHFKIELFMIPFLYVDSVFCRQQSIAYEICCFRCFLWSLGFSAGICSCCCKCNIRR